MTDTTARPATLSLQTARGVVKSQTNRKGKRISRFRRDF